MPKTLEDIIRQQILIDGPMDLGAFMSLALGHPEHGYYMKQDPFGKDGDFTTAPEVSQMFGELIGAWVADIWMRAGSPTRMHLLECGPGRGTLMSDILRVTAAVPGFHNALQIYLMETSPVLRAKQAECLSSYSPQWISQLLEISDEAPLICLGNEFLDALPVRQLQKTEDGWRERMIAVNDNDDLILGLADVSPAHVSAIPTQDYPVGTIYEIAPVRDLFVKELSERIHRCGGAALFVDYGYDAEGVGDTLQALRAHEFVSILETPGDADLTAHVDFCAVKQRGEAEGLIASNIVSQTAFLKSLGLDQRRDILRKSALDSQKTEIDSGYERLTSPDQMGELFKVLSLYHPNWPAPAGFE